MNIEGRIISNRYEIIEKVGSGGMATVYKARDTILNRYVAVKVLRDEFTTDEEFIKRFNTEAQSAARLTHPNIVSVFDVGQEYNIYYIVMELIQGKTLKQIISEEGALPWKWTVNIAIQICSALEMAHRNGIIHRDIKPHNIIITEDGIAKVTDFGIAKAVSNSTITAFGTTIGSVHYFSPEHARGGYTDAKSDLYSLGVVMYEMVTGKVPFDADTPVSVALKHMQEEPIEPIKLNSKIPEAVNQIILKAMKKEASARYSSATVMMKDLSMALKNPYGNFVEEKNTGDFTKIIPTITEKMANENNYREHENERNDEKQDRVQSKSAFAKYLEENPKMKPVIYTAIALGVLLLCIFIFWGSLKLSSKLIGGNSNSSYQNGKALQDYTNTSIEDAKTKLNELGYKYDIEEVYSNDIAAGIIISQKPSAGTSYDPSRNSPIKLVVSKGAKIVTMPKLKGLTYDEAVEELKKVDLQAEKIDEVSQTVEEGIVIKQEIKDGEQINAGTIVKVYVSSGNGLEKVTVPYVVDFDVEEAKKQLTEKKLEVNITYQEDTKKSNGVVLKQSIDVGTVVDEGSAITITVNKIQENVKGTININVKSLAKTHLSEEQTSNDDTNKTTDANTTTSKKTASKNVTIKVLVGNDKIYEKSVSSDSENLNLTFEGKGNVTIKVYINEILANGKSYTMDLNSDNRILEIK